MALRSLLIALNLWAIPAAAGDWRQCLTDFDCEQQTIAACAGGDQAACTALASED